MTKPFSTKPFSRRALMKGFGAAAMVAPSGSVLAQSWPARPITMIVVFAPGGPTDVMARIVSEHMSRTLGQPITIENVAGAGGTTGGTRGARAEPDGYTLTVGSLGSHAAAAALYPSIAYDSRELEPVGMIAGTPGYVVVRREFPATNLADFIAHVRANPDKVTCGHAGVGSTPHLAALYLAHLAGLRFNAIAYRGSGPAMNDLVAGHVDCMCDLAPTVTPQIRGGTIRGLVLAQPGRSLVTPDVPSSREAGLPEYVFAGWNGIFAPKGTPRSVTDRLSAALSAALADDATRRRIEELGSIPTPVAERTQDAMRRVVAQDVERWATVIKAAGVTLN